VRSGCKKRSGNRGFTLVEVLVSLMILAVTSIILYQTWGTGLRAVRKGKDYNTITLLLQRKAVEWEAQNKLKRVDELKDDETGDFGDDYPEYKWEVKLKPFEMPPVLPKADAASGDQQQLQEIIMKTMKQYFEKAVREIQITVIHTVGDKKLKYSVNNIYVDYSQELPTGI
jgi:prepilin-type N-terminal cleavage/methylation domain-containing protein